MAQRVATDKMSKYAVQVQTPSGKPMEVRLRKTFAGGARLDVTLPTIGLKGSCSGVTPLHTPKKGATHYLQLGKTAVGIDRAVAAQIDALISAYRADWEASPEGVAETLRRQRETLRVHVVGAQHEIDRAKERAFNLDTGAGWGRVGRLEAEWGTQRQALRDFDAEHPEIVQQLNAEREAAALRRAMD